MEEAAMMELLDHSDHAADAAAADTVNLLMS